MMNRDIQRRRAISIGWIYTLCLFTLTIFGSPQDVPAQWATSGNNINNTNTGNVGVGTSTPGSKLTVNTSSAAATATVSITPDGSNQYYAGNNHDALFVDGSLLSPHGTYTSAQVRLLRLRAQTGFDIFTVGRTGDVVVAPETRFAPYTLKLGPDANNSYYAPSDYDILLISGTGYNAHGVYTSKTLRPLRVTNA
jgi:hypothetical protein